MTKNWKEIKNSIEDYVSPMYYNQLLKPYKFGGVSDLEMLKKVVEGKKFNNVLELGCGSGRVTDVFLNNAIYNKFTLVDQSKNMIDYLNVQLSEKNNLIFVQSDHIEFIQNTNVVYDLVYSLWSLSHSIHQNMHSFGFEKGSKRVKNILVNFVENNMASGSLLYIVHFDSRSEEQSILMRQWKRVYEVFEDLNSQSPSKILLDELFLELDNKKVLTYEFSHLKGDKIEYESEEELLEIFMNLHLETYFNNTKLFDNVLQDILDQSKIHKNKDGKYLIGTGLYIYKITKN